MHFRDLKKLITFRCATEQWLCGTICFNQFMPMNLTRFWTWQMVVLGFCALLFVWFIDGPSKGESHDLIMFKQKILSIETWILDLKLKSDLEKRSKSDDAYLAPHEKTRLQKLQKKYANSSGWQIYRGRKEIMMWVMIWMFPLIDIANFKI